MTSKQDLRAINEKLGAMTTPALRLLYEATQREIFSRWRKKKERAAKRERKVKQRAAAREREERRRLGTRGASNGITPTQVRELVEEALDRHLAFRQRRKKKYGARYVDVVNSWQCAQTLDSLMKPIAKGRPIPTVPQIVACIRALAKDPAQRIEFWNRDEGRRRAANLRPFRRRLPR